MPHPKPLLIQINFLKARFYGIFNDLKSCKVVYKIMRTVIVLDNMTEIPISRDLYEVANQAVIKFFPDN